MQAAHFSSLPAVAITVAPQALASWIAVTPMPLVPPWTSSVSPGLQARPVEHVRPDGEEGLGQARRLDVGQASRAPAGIARPAPRTAPRSRRRRPARRRGHRCSKPAAAIAAASPLDDRSRHFQARQVGRARRHRVQALALQHVGPVHAGRRDANQHLARRPPPGPGARRAAAPRARRTHVISIAFMADVDPAAVGQSRHRLPADARSAPSSTA